MKKTGKIVLLGAFFASLLFCSACQKDNVTAQTTTSTDTTFAKGADVNAVDREGITPLRLATQHYRYQTAEVLKKHGGSFKAKPAGAKKGKTK